MASKSEQTPTSHPWTLPRFRETLRYPWTAKCEGLPPKHIFYDAKFYPYHTSSTTAPVFALVGNREVAICRPSQGQHEQFKIIRVVRDLEPVPKDWSSTASLILNSCAWNYIDQSVPLLSVGGPSGLIKVLNATTGELFTTLVGHGSEVNDLVTHPLYPWILASASGDHSVRVWDLRKCMEKGEKACLIICGHGQGHKEAVLTCAWHGLGAYLISGGQDHVVCLWTIPDLSPDSPFLKGDSTVESRSSSETRVIHYPHFTTSSIHCNYVDCVAFYGDLILSKAAEENKIVLWMITGFNSKGPPPSPDFAPSTRTLQDTRSGFMRPESQRVEHTILVSEPDGSSYSNVPLFTRLLEFSVPFSELFYMRFSLLVPSRSHPHLHPVLAIGNTRTKVLFWDLFGLKLGYDSSTVMASSVKDGNTPKLKPPDSRQKRKSWRAKANAPASSAPETYTNGIPIPHASPPAPVPDMARAPPRSVKYRINEPSTPIPAHHSHTPNVNYHLLTRQAAWSLCGRWCVVAGESGSKDAMAAVYDRWV